MIALAISFYMDNSLAVWDSVTENLVEVPVNRPMGIGVVDQGIYLGSKYGFSWFEEIFYCLENKWLYRQNFTKYMGFVDCHELVVSNGQPIFANTLFSCLSTISPSALKDFSIYAQPKFVQELRPEDNCHLNGIATEDGKPRYISCFAPNNEPGFKSWKHKPQKGCVWDLAFDRPVINDLSLPHSPRVIDGDLFVCDSGRGRVLRRSGNRLEEVISLKSFTRGLIATEQFIIIGTSRVRDGKVNPQVERDNLTVNRCGLHFCDRSSLKLVQSYYFDDKKEIFDFQLIPTNHYIVSADSEPFPFIHLL
jgi:uncharacterized protein (TIGR03032 family)